MTAPAESLRIGTVSLPRAAPEPWALATLDGISVAIAIAIGVWAGWGEGAGDSRGIIAVSLLIAWPIWLNELRSRSTTILGSGPEEYRRVVKASSLAVGTVAVMAYFLQLWNGRSFLLGVGVLGTSTLLVERHLMRRTLQRRLRHGRAINRVYIVGSGSAAQPLLDQMDGSRGVFHRVGMWDTDTTPAPEPQAIVAAAKAADADAVLYAPGTATSSGWARSLGWALEPAELSLLVTPSLVEVAGPRLSLEPVAGVAVVKVDPPRLTGPARATKRVIDILGSALGLVLLAIPMLLIGLIIRATSPGPGIFKQVRAGAGGTTFLCWKFRTMSDGADAERAALRAQHSTGGAAFKMSQDPRVTPIGRWLRRFSLDELPQLVNVLRGDMSLVGPRPHPLDDLAHYDDLARRRLLTKPGITGLWQVSGRSDLAWDDSVQLDLHYVENWSLSLDLVIFLRTAKAVLSGQGAY